MKKNVICKIWLVYLFLCYKNSEILQGINLPVAFYVHVAVSRNKFIFNKTNQMH